MTRTDNSGAFKRLTARLATRAAEVGATAAENHVRQRRGDAGRWRDARLLWPLAVNTRKED